MTPDEELRRRLRAADPARAVPPPPELADHLLRRTREHLMRDQDQPATHEASPRSSWLPLAAAAAVVVTGLAAYLGLQALDDGPGADGEAPVASEPTVAELVLPDGAPGRCMQVTPLTVGNAETALAGTVAEVADAEVLLDVERWYAGGTADQVRLAVASPQALAPRLPGMPEFEVGERWLVTAVDGRVNVCGFTAPWSPRLAGVFDEAFGA